MINDLTIGELKQLQGIVGGGGKSHSYVMGEKYFIQTVTNYFTGRIVAITDTDIVLETASWVAWVGRFYNAMKTGELDEVEPFPGQVIVDRGGIISSSIWNHELPKEQK